eukprot:UN28925
MAIIKTKSCPKEKTQSKLRTLEKFLEIEGEIFDDCITRLTDFWQKYIVDTGCKFLGFSVCNSTYNQAKRWEKLTSPAHDSVVFKQLFNTFGLPFVCFTNLTGSQIQQLNRVLRNILKQIENKKSVTMFFHFSGHGAVLKEKKGLGLQFVGIDGDNSKGCCPLAKFTNSVELEKVNKIIVGDCCRENIVLEKESKGFLQEKAPSTLTIFACRRGRRSYAPVNSPSMLSKCLRENVSKFFNPDGFKGDFVNYMLTSCANASGESVFHGDKFQCLFGDDNKQNVEQFHITFLKEIGFGAYINNF